MVLLGEAQRRAYAERTLQSLPGAFVRRLNDTGRAAFPPVLAALRFIAPIGLLFAGGAGAVALASVVLLILLHMTMPHDSSWVVYYLDVFPAITFGAVIALRRWLDAAARSTAVFSAFEARGAGVAMLFGLGLIYCGQTLWAPPRVGDHSWMSREVFFRSGICALPPGPRIIFVKPRPEASPHHSLIDNDPRWQTSDVWIVRSWEAQRNRALIESAPGRAAYIYDENAGWFARMGRDGVATHEGVVNVLKVDREPGQSYTCL
jgi:hypothetical protein